MATQDQTILESTEYISAQEESLFARDLDGQLIRLTEATLKDLETPVHVTIDGYPFTVMKALPQRDSQGVIQRDANGEPIPRATTIYDAVSGLYANELHASNPIPILCHREHMSPVGVCRICLVEIEEKRKSGRVKKDLVSSCTYHVKEGMVITTLGCSDSAKDRKDAVARIQASVSVVVELLASEHLTQTELQQLSSEPQATEPNELKSLVKRFVNLEASELRFSPSERHLQRGMDMSSELIAVNHDACVLCQRCHRACNEIKENFVLGRTGKGYATKIAFDFNVEMAASSCVSCGECAISCPTDALTFHPKVIERQNAKLRKEGEEHRFGQSAFEILTPEAMLEIPIFSGIPYKFLQFNAGACVRRRLKPGETLCEQGDYGATAFLIQKGKFEILFRPKTNTTQRPKAVAEQKRGWFDFFKPSRPAQVTAQPPSLVTGADVVADSEQRAAKLTRGVEDVILGEMACLNHYPRTATVVAIDDSEVIEIGSNVLYMLQRNSSSRKILNDAYRRHALNTDLEKLPVFQGLTDEGRKATARNLAENAELISVEPGQTIFKQGEASDDFYLIRLGYVKITRRQGSVEHIVNYLGPDGRDGRVGSFGEIAALSKIYQNELREKLDELNYPAGIRTASCTALDHVELVRIRSADLKRIADANPDFRDYLIERARQLLTFDSRRDQELDSSKFEFLELGLYNAQSLLVLDLESCTRCDECTKACADAHDGESRLIREGVRFENFLVATSCRSCTDPYCLVGCPVNAIFRQGSKEIVIEDHCIGCGLCASNCPYGNITMYGHEREDPTLKDGRSIPVVQQKATTCDQCKSLDSDPRCVYACLHHAAYRMTGFELQERILAKQTTP